jgi:hypothetical protein
MVLYILLAGYPPDSHAIRNSAHALDYPSPFFDGVGTETKELISACLNIDARKRPTARDALAAIEDITPTEWIFPV